jgi:hypothetical protein
LNATAGIGGLHLSLGAKPGSTLILGKSGSGKTTFALKMMRCPDFTCRFIFQEPKRDLAVRLGLADAETPDDLACAVEDGFVIYYPAAMFPGDWSAGLTWFCDWSYGIAARMPGRKVLLVDEVWKYCDPRQLPKPLALWLQDGRSYGMETVFATQRPNRLNETLINEATEAVCFRLQGRNALKVAEELGADPEEVASLPLGAFVSVNCETGGEIRGRMW